MIFCVSLVMGEEAAAPADAAGEGSPAEEEQDETKALLAQLTIAMVSEVVDEHTLEIRDSGKNAGESRRGKIHLRLGNVKPWRQGAAHSDEQHAERRATSKKALEALLAKQMIWWKAAPDEHQPPAPAEGSKEPPVVIGDVWLIDGRHVNGHMAKEGHVDRDTKYHSDLARNILTAESEEKKKESYAELERALKESEKAKAEAKKKIVAEELEKEKLKGEPIGLSGWIGLSFLGVIILAALCNFGRPSKKKVNLNRKRGPFERFWMKLKGA